MNQPTAFTGAPSLAPHPAPTAPWAGEAAYPPPRPALREPPAFPPAAPRPARRRTPQAVPVLTISGPRTECHLNAAALALLPPAGLPTSAALCPPVAPAHCWQLDLRPHRPLPACGRGYRGGKGLRFRAPALSAWLQPTPPGAAVRFVLRPCPASPWLFWLDPLGPPPAPGPPITTTAAPSPAARYWGSTPTSRPNKAAPSVPVRPLARKTLAAERAEAQRAIAEAALPYRDHPIHTVGSFAALSPADQQRVDHECGRQQQRRTVEAPDGSRYTVCYRPDQTGLADNTAPTR